ncbi:hypothetical protein ACP275_11G003500 [Erythranthe tilingii]
MLPIATTNKPPRDFGEKQEILSPEKLFPALNLNKAICLMTILRLSQGDNTVAAVAVLAAVADDIQYPLTKDLDAVKLDSSHYLFSDSAFHDEDQRCEKVEK